MDIWSWMCDLPISSDWPESNSPLTLELATSPDASILFKAERTSGSNTDTLVTFSVILASDTLHHKTLWLSDPCPLSSDKPFLPLVLQLLHEIILRSPNSPNNASCPRSQLQRLKPEPISWILDSHSPESSSAFFNLVFLFRLFFLCVFDAPADVGSLYFKSLLGPHILDLRSCKHVVRNFFVAVGVDVELCFMRTLGYMVTKWILLLGSNVGGVGLQVLNPDPLCYNFSYAVESHGLWILKGFAPISSMNPTRIKSRDHHQVAAQRQPLMDAKESVIRYTLAHQQLEAVVQLEYSVYFHESYIQVIARVNNLRFHVVKLGYGTKKEVYEERLSLGSEYADEKYFPTKIRVWVGPELGSTYVTGLSLGRSTENPESEMEIERVLMGGSGMSKISAMKIKARNSTRQKTRNWRWDQDAEGNAAVFEGVLCDNNLSSTEMATWTGGNKRFGRTGGGLVFAGDEYGDGVGWRLNREMEGSVLKWRMGAKVWLSYRPHNMKSRYYDTRSVDWCDEVDLPLIQEK